MSRDSIDTVSAAAAGPKTTDNRAFAAALSLALLAMLLSAALLSTSWLLMSPELREQRNASTRESLRPWKISGSDLIARAGEAEKMESGGLRIVRLEHGEDIRGIFSRRTGFKAADYPFLEFDIVGRNPTSYYYFIWRTGEDPDTVHSAALPWNGNHSSVNLLTKHPAWNGTIIEAGLDIYGDLRHSNPTVEHLTLLPTSELNLLRVLFTEWTALRAWSQKSPNYLRGTPPHPIISPTFALACWAGIALAIAALLRFFLSFSLVHAGASVLLIAWISLDLLWQRNLSWQLQETQTLFAGKTQHEKHLADREQELYQYAQHLKNNVLPKPGVKIYLLHDSEDMAYRKLKAQFYLLPHNIFNYDKFPRPSRLQSGDYVLVLDKIEELVYLPEKKQLRWGRHKQNVELLDEAEIGQLYIVGDSQ